MAMGRPPKPNEQKRLAGNPGKRPLAEPVRLLPVASSVPPAPKGMRVIGRRAWKLYWSLGSAWLSPRTDVHVLARLCRAYDEEAELREEMDRHDFERVIHTARGVISNPIVMQLRKVEEMITRYEGLCGFNPSDRSRLGLAEVQRVSKLDQFLAKQRESG